MAYKRWLLWRKPNQSRCINTLKSFCFDNFNYFKILRALFSWLIQTHTVCKQIPENLSTTVCKVVLGLPAICPHIMGVSWILNIVLFLSTRALALTLCTLNPHCWWACIKYHPKTFWVIRRGIFIATKIHNSRIYHIICISHIYCSILIIWN